jgi:hypothetical protein
MDPAFEYVRTNPGIDTESSYPYEATNGPCRFRPETVGAECTGKKKQQHSYTLKVLLHKETKNLFAPHTAVVPISTQQSFLHNFYKTKATLSSHLQYHSNFFTAITITTGTAH